MKRTELKPGAKSLERGSTFSAERKPLKRSALTPGGYEAGEGKPGRPPRKRPPKRDWTAARAKCDAEEVCRVGRDGGCEGKLEAAHIIGRERDLVPGVGGPEHIYGKPTYPVLPERIVPLCTKHHRLYDAHKLDLLGCLTPEEEAQAVLDADGLELARKRLNPSAYRNGVAA